MTQSDYNSLPLLLQRHEVFGALPELTQRALYEYRADGDLRTFAPDPDRSAFRYYFKADVGRIHGGLALDLGWLAGLPAWIQATVFCQASGLGEHALERACASGQLVAVRKGQGGHRRFWARDLEWFV